MCLCDFDSVTFWNLLEPSGTFSNLLEPSGTFWNLLEPFGTFWNLLEASGSFWNLLVLQNFKLITDGQTDISTSRAAPSQLKMNNI